MEEVCASVHREVKDSMSRFLSIYFFKTYEGGIEALERVTKLIKPIWLALAPTMIGVFNHEITLYIKWLVSITWIPYVCYILEDRIEQVFLMLYTLVQLSKKKEVGVVASGSLWGLLLPSLVLASHALPSEQGAEQNGTRRWRILSITWHLMVLYMEVSSDITDPSVESVVAGVIVLYIMSLDVWTGLSIIFLILMAVAVQMLSLVDLRSLNTETVYAVLFALEQHFLSYSIEALKLKS